MPLEKIETVININIPFSWQHFIGFVIFAIILLGTNAETSKAQKYGGKNIDNSEKKGVWGGVAIRNLLEHSATLGLSRNVSGD